MRLQFVGHASFIFETGSKKIICDPWLKGKAFNDSWALLSPPIEVDFGKIDYIWFSHEHPDHFNIETIKSIPVEDKKRIRVLFQYQPSSRMVNAFRKLGFENIIELPLWKWSKIDDFQILVGPAGSLDSFCILKSASLEVLNLNDCILSKSKLRRLKSLCSRRDILLTQFSFANWAGNETDDTAAAKRKISQYTSQVEILHPKHVVPFASYVYFCQPENFRMNAWANSPRYISSLFPNTVILYNGETYDPSTQKDSHDNEMSLRKYEEDLSQIKVCSSLSPRSQDEIEKAAHSMFSYVSNGLPSFMKPKFKPVSFYVKDLESTLVVDMHRQSIEWGILSPADTRYVTSSQPLWFLLNFPWGAGTFYVSGMYLDKGFSEGLPKLFKWLIYLSADILNVKEPLRFLKYWISRRTDLYDLLLEKMRA